MAGPAPRVAFSFEMVMAGAILLTAMAAGGLAVLRRAKSCPPTDKSAEAGTEA